MSILFESDNQTYVFTGFPLDRVGFLERDGRRVREITGGATKPLLGAGVIRAVGGGAIGGTTGFALGLGVGGVIGFAEGAGVRGVIGFALGPGVGGVIGRLEGLPTGLLEGGLYTDPTGAASVYVA